MGACDNLVTLVVTSWTDSQIVLGGFAGFYGSNGWVLNKGDDVAFYVWNAQSSAGPASANTIVGTGATSSHVLREQ
jgi:hypothetical protein